MFLKIYRTIVMILNGLTDIVDRLDTIIHLLSIPVPAGFRVTLHGGNMQKRKALSLDFTIFENGMATASLTPVDAAGVETEMPAGASIPSWTCTDPSIGVSPSADGLTALLTAGTVPVDNATVTATATLADGTVISGTSENFDVAPQPPGSAVAFKIKLSA